MTSLAVAANERTAQLTRIREALGLERLAQRNDRRPSRRTRWRLRLGLRLVVLGAQLLDPPRRPAVSAAGERRAHVA